MKTRVDSCVVRRSSSTGRLAAEELGGARCCLEDYPALSATARSADLCREVDRVSFGIGFTGRPPGILAVL